MKNALLKILTFIFALCMVISVATACGGGNNPPQQACSHVYENGSCKLCGEKAPSVGLEYKLINNDTEYEVKGIGGCKDINIVIPSTYLGKPVSSIGNDAFRRASLKSIEIGNSVTSIGDYAFSWCNFLQSVEIGNSVTSIGDSAFYDCRSLTSIDIPNSVTSIGSDAFSYCNSLTYNIKDGLKYLGNNINPYLYLAGVVSKDITTATIDNNCRFVGSNAFTWCDSLTSIDIPNSVTSIGDLAFANCYSLTYNKKAGLEYLGNNINPYLYLAGVVSKDITTATIDNNCRFIGSNAFTWCDSLTSIDISNSVTSIGYCAFSSCDSLQSVEIGNRVTSIGEHAFSSCDSLQSIEVDSANEYYKSIDGNLYSKDGKILIQYAPGKTATSFTISNSVTSIGDEAFFGCDSLTSIDIPDSVTSIGYCAFSSCDSLRSITFDGTKEEWMAIEKGYNWNYNVPATYVQCIDGDVDI